MSTTNDIVQEGIDRQMMARAIRLAKKGLYTSSPNPRVGCVICKHNQVIAEGWHQKAGEAHAEIHAMEQLSLAQGAQQIKGATVYVSLEPCSHQGKTGACAKALVDAQVARVVCSMTDPAPQVSGSGIAMLKQAGINVQVGLLENEARALNPGFIKRMEQGLPYVRVKLAMSLDGRTALSNGESKWITGEAARLDVHHWRARSDLVLTGSETVLQDNPLMTARLPKAATTIKQALRCVIDNDNRVPKTANIFSGDSDTKVIGSSEQADWQVSADKQGKVDLERVLEKFAQEEINEVWVEAGASLAGAFIERKLFDELIIYMAPVIMGDQAKPLLKLKDLHSMQETHQLSLLDTRCFNRDQRFIFQQAFSNK